MHDKNYFTLKNESIPNIGRPLTDTENNEGTIEQGCEELKMQEMSKEIRKLKDSQELQDQSLNEMRRQLCFIYGKKFFKQ